MITSPYDICAKVQSICTIFIFTIYYLTLQKNTDPDKSGRKKNTALTDVTDYTDL